MTEIRVTNQKIRAAAIVWKWPGALITCQKEGDDTLVTWHDNSPVLVKTKLEIASAQNDWDAFTPWVNLRAERNTKLVDSDWTQYNDSPLTDEVKAEWAVHRESLRDLPANTDDPANPSWPEAPE
jgi:hypothetical protein